MLEQLSGMDAGFLYMETEQLHMHTLKVAILDPDDSDEDVSFDRFRRELSDRLALLPGFRQRAVDIPLGLGHPVWIDDERFELDRHLAHRSLAPPGDHGALDALISEIASRTLPRDRPLWEITMVDGLEGGRLAFVGKIHHSMADGSAALEMLMRVLDGRFPIEAEPTPDEPPPSRWALVALALRSGWLRLRALPALIVHTVRGLANIIRGSDANTTAEPVIPFLNPATAFNAALTPGRSFASTSLPLDSLLDVKRRLGVTLNDVVLAVCGGALRAHLEAAGSLPTRSLVAGVPVNTRPDERGRARGNHVGHLFASLATHVADPIERLRAIHAGMRIAKQRQAMLGADILERWADYTPPRLYTALVGVFSRKRVADHIHGPMNLVVSTVRGPAEEQRVAGLRLVSLYSVGPILEGVGLNFTGWSYAGRMNIVGLSCPSLIPDLRALVERLPRALVELERACDAQRRASDQDPTAGPTGRDGSPLRATG